MSIIKFKYLLYSHRQWSKTNSDGKFECITDEKFMEEFGSYKAIFEEFAKKENFTVQSHQQSTTPTYVYTWIQTKKGIAMLLSDSILQVFIQFSKNQVEELFSFFFQINFNDSQLLVDTKKQSIIVMRQNSKNAEVISMNTMFVKPWKLNIDYDELLYVSAIVKYFANQKY